MKGPQCLTEKQLHFLLFTPYFNLDHHICWQQLFFMQSCKGLELPLAAEPHQMLQVLLLPTNTLYTS